MNQSFDSDQWLNERKIELVNLMFTKELGIQDFRNTSVIINFDDLQSDTVIERFDKYRKALRAFFGANEIRSLLDYYYLDKDKKPLLNLLKQILKYYGYKLSRVSEYQGNYGGTKMYKSRYTIIKAPVKKQKKTEQLQVPEKRSEQVPDSPQVPDPK
jgi:hypothetical protein